MHQHKHRPKENEFRKHYERRREEKRMQKAERQARDAIRKPPKRRRMPRDEQDW